MNKIYVKIGTQFYEMDKLSLALTAIDTPANVEELDFYDGTKVSSYVDSSYDGSKTSNEVVDKYNNKVKEFKQAKTDAVTKEDIEAASGLKPELAVFKHAITVKQTAKSELDADVDVLEIEEPKKEEPKKEEPKVEPVEEPKKEETPPVDEPKKEETAEPDKGGETPPTEPTAVTDEEINKLLDGEGVSARELVKTASIIVRERKQGITAGALGARETPDFRNHTVFDRALTRDRSDFIVASAGASPGEVLKSNSDDFWGYLTESWNEAFFSGHEKPTSFNLGSFRELKGPVLQEGSFLDRASKPGMTASLECMDVDHRDAFITCDNLGNDLTGLFQTFASNKCQVEYLKDISMWQLAPGITYWSKKRYADYCAARDELNQTIAATGPEPTAAELTAIAGLQAKLAVLQKRCADVGCMTREMTNQLEDISACINYSKRQEQCSEREIRRHLQLLEKLYLRARNSHMMNFIDECSVIVEVDACDFGGLDICHIVDEVVQNKVTYTDEKERRTGSDRWVGIAQDRFMQFLGSGPRKGGSYSNGNEGFTKNSIAGLDGVLTTVDNYAQPIDPADPESEIDLIPVPDTLGDAYPEPGTVLNYSQDCQYQTEWCLYVLDPSEGFALRKPDTRLNAAFNHETAKGNWVNGPFMENTVSYNKDGCTPWYKFVFKNAFNSGARYADVPAQSICEVAGEEPKEG